MTDAPPRLTRRSFTALGVAAIAGGILPVAARSAGSSDLVTISGAAFGTAWQVVLPRGADAGTLGHAITDILAEVDRQMSPWRPESDISRFNAARAGRHALPAETLFVVRAALDLAGASGGAFDPTVGPLVSRWGFGPISGDAMADWRALSIAEDGLEKSDAGVTLDLCGIAKGRAIDRISALLTLAGQTDHLIDIGGELRASGAHPAGRPWRSAVEDPRPGAKGNHAILALGDDAIATSGTRWNRLTLGDTTYSHIIAPTRRSAESGRLASVSVIAPTAMMADGWATALMAAGEDAGPELARRSGLTSLFLLSEGADLHRITTGGFDAYLVG